jgi:hypothetical protein
MRPGNLKLRGVCGADHGKPEILALGPADQVIELTRVPSDASR